MWQRIDSAPRDGTEVLLWYPDFKQHVRVGHFSVSEHFMNGARTFKSEKWWCGTFTLNLLDGSEPTPTHWMPLPPNPEI